MSPGTYLSPILSSIHYQFLTVYLMTDYRFYSSVFVRTPFFCFPNYTPFQTAELLVNKTFLKALYIANPEFYKILEAKNFEAAALKSKELLSLSNYYNRMNFRPTPFGMFSCFTLASWGDQGKIILAPNEDVNISLMPDLELSKLVMDHFAESQENGNFRMNPTLYKLGGEYRFIKTSRDVKTTRLKFSLESVSANTIITGLAGFIKKKRADKNGILKYLMRTAACGPEDALDYFFFLQNSQLIMSQLHVNIVGQDHWARFYSCYLKDHLYFPGHIFKRFTNAIRSNEASLGFIRQAEKDLTSAFLQSGFSTPEKLLYCNTERPLVSGDLPRSIQQDLSEAMNCLHLLVPQGRLVLIERFIKDFKQRFDGQKIPLLQALDPDAGVGYGEFAEPISASPLLKQVRTKTLKKQTGVMDWTAAHQVLLKKWSGAADARLPIIIMPEDIANLDTNDNLTSPATQAIMFRIVDGLVLIESAGGVSATSLIGRFTLFSDDMKQLGRKLASKEIDNNQNVLFAEIGQLSDDRIDNINKRAAIYDYEIPINSISILPEDQQLLPSDLYVSVENDTIFLESKKLRKRVIPRLSSAFNSRHNYLAIFRFLYDLQYADLHSDLYFDPENFFPGMDFYPRISFKSTILSPAKWHLRGQDIKDCQKNEFSSAVSALNLIRQKTGIPNRILLTKADQQLFYDLESKDEARYFLECLKGMDNCVIQEALLPQESDKTVTDSSGVPFVNQCLAFIYRKEEIYEKSPVKKQMANTYTERTFILGSSWLYFKIYCTEPRSNDILTDQLFKVTRELKKHHAMWFFVRYHDPGNHIRFRVKVSELQPEKVIQMMKKRFAGLVKYNLVREYQADTYRREIHRYGADIILQAEEFFHASSELIIHFLKSKGDLFSPCPEHRIAIVNFNTMLTIMLPDISLQIKFLEFFGQSFFEEFNGDKTLRLELDKQYRDLRKDFEIVGKEREFYKEIKLSFRQNAFEKCFRAFAERTASFSLKRRMNLLGDLIHMHCNRLFSDQQRKQEMVLYFCFHKLKLSEAARLKNKKS